MRSFEEKVLATISRYQMLSEGEEVLVAVSGGVDSMVLLSVLQRLPLRLNLSVFHLNHGLRAKAEDEAKMVAQYAKKHSLPCFIERIAFDLHAQKGKSSLQVAAREERYRLLGETAQRLGSDKIALGHQADDQGETVLMRFLTGAGPEGLAGIPPVRQKYIRPLIEVGREEIVSYARDLKLSWAEDESNTKPVYLRNRIRHSLIPYLQSEYQPELGGRLKETAEICREWNEVMEGLAGEVLSKWGLLVDGRLQPNQKASYLTPVRDWLELPPALQRLVFRQLFFSLASPGARLGFNHSQAVLQLLAGVEGKSIHLPGGVSCRRESQCLLLGQAQAEEVKKEVNNEYLIPVNIPGLTLLPGGKGKVESRWLTLEQLPAKWEETSPFEFYLDAEQIAFPVYLRNRKPGDRFSPLGLKGSKKIKDFLIDAKIPLSQRALYPLLVDREETVLGVMGVRPDQRKRITKDSRRILYLKYQHTE